MLPTTPLGDGVGTAARPRNLTEVGDAEVSDVVDAFRDPKGRPGLFLRRGLCPHGGCDSPLLARAGVTLTNHQAH